MSNTSNKLTITILDKLNKSRDGNTARQLYMMLGEWFDLECLRVTLSQMVRRGHLRIDGKIICKCCGVEHTCYRITDSGRMRLNENNYTLS